LGFCAIVAAIVGATASPGRAQLNLNPFAPYYKNIARAVQANDVGRVRTLLADGGSPNETDEGGSAGMHIAAGSGNLQLMAILYKAGADINQKDAIGSTPLDYAAEHGRLEAAKLLIQMKANVNAQNKNGMSPLMFAAKTGDPELVRMLLAGGANANANDYTGRDAAGWALESHRQGVVQILKDAQRKH
jgi:ankyrin repeat protein